MISIFSKRIYLADCLSGCVDFHNHILPGIDDGAKSIKESVQLIKGLNELGINTIICSPHIYSDYYPNDSQTIEQAYNNLIQSREYIDEISPSVSIDFCAEHMIDSHFEKLLISDEYIKFKERYLLMEMSFHSYPINLDSVLGLVKEKRLFPILAHPERYGFIRSGEGRYRKLKDKGVYFQANLLSFGGYYGSEVQKKLSYLIDKKLIDFIGTDIHNSSQLKELKKIVISKKQRDAILGFKANNDLHFSN